jgi:hypothetical protein
MDREVLALVSPNSSLEDAFGRFRNGTRAIVVDAPAGRYLLTADDLTDEWNDIADAKGNPAAVTVGTLRPRHRFTPTPRLPILHLLLEGLPNLSPLELNYFGIAFQDPEHQYTIQDASDDAAVVVTSSEDVAGGMRTASGVTRFCTCVGSPVHRFEQSKIVNQWYCNKPHGVPVKCRSVDDT